MKQVKQNFKSKSHELVNTRSGSVEVRSVELTPKESQTLNVGYATNKSDLRWQKV